MNPDQIEHPSNGGSYLRNADGSLTLVEQTVPTDAAPAATVPPVPVAALSKGAAHTSARDAD